MNRGVPPTPLNARTGELTPPGMTSRAAANADSDFAVLRTFRCCMDGMIGRRGALFKLERHPFLLPLLDEPAEGRDRRAQLARGVVEVLVEPRVVQEHPRRAVPLVELPRGGLKALQDPGELVHARVGAGQELVRAVADLVDAGVDLLRDLLEVLREAVGA